MLLNKNWCTGTGLALLAFLCGCSSSHKAEKAPENSAPVTVASVAMAPATPEMTATEAATDVDADSPPTSTVIDNASGMLSPTAPRDYVVRRGDTLWGIANTFLKDPWLWPEIWYVNSQVKNPHLIYPGDTLHLAYGANGQPQIQLERGSAARLHPQLHSGDSGAIANIPYDAIAAFFSKPGVLSKEEVDHAPYVLALLDDHQIAGLGHQFYSKKLTAGAGERFVVMHVDQPLKDPQSHRHLGYLAIYAGASQVVRGGEPALNMLTDSGREVVRGDVLIPDTSTVVQGLVPHAPTQAVDGRVIAIVNGVLIAGQWEVVALNRGTKDGLEPGNVLKSEEAGSVVVDHGPQIAGSDTRGFGHKVQLPSEASGTLLVFKTYEEMSYALVVNVTKPVALGDHVRNP